MNNDTGVYTLTNTLTGDLYVGSAVSFKLRWARHRRELRAHQHHNLRLQRAWDKYGEAAFIFEKIALCPSTDLLVVEQARIDSLCPAYNICRIAGNPTCVEVSAETRAKLSAALTGKKFSPERRARMSEIGLNMSADTKAKIAASLTGKTHSADTRAKMSASKMGKPKSEAMRKNMSAMASNRPEDYYDALRAASMRTVRCMQNGMVFKSIREAVKWLRDNGSPKATNGNISSCCLGKRSIAFGYTWRYAD